MEKEKNSDNTTNETPASYPLSYRRPTSGIPLVAIPLSLGDTFSLNKKFIAVNPSSDSSIIVPSETQDPAEMDDRQNVFNIVAAGCNLATKEIVKNDFTRLMDFCSNKIGLLLSNSWIRQNIDRNLTTFHSNVYPPNETNHQAFAGFNLIDEPTLQNLDGLKTNDRDTKDYLKHSYYCLAKDIHERQQTYPDWNPLVHVNLFPIHHFQSSEDYQRYLDEYQSIYNPAYYSFDLYPIAQFNPLRSQPGFLAQYSKLAAGSYVQFHERFYRTLQMISDQSRKYGKPFWSYLLTSEHTTEDGYFPAPKEQFLRYMAFTALAYGAKGLCYWRFLQNHDDRQNLNLDSDDKNSGWQSESYFRHPIREDRRRTPYWYYVRRINKEIRKYENIFLSADLKGVYHTNTDQMWHLASQHVPNGIVYGISSMAGRDAWGLVPLNQDSIPVISSIVSQSKGLGVLASHFSGPRISLSSLKAIGTDPGNMNLSEYAVIVNHDAINYQTISIRFKGDRIVDELTPLSSSDSLERKTIDCSANPVITRTLPPGGYLIFHWDNQTLPLING